MEKLGFVAAVAVCLGGASLVSAQDVQVQAQGTVSIGQPPPPVYQQPVPPPGYGQPVYGQPQVYVQPQVYQPQPQYYVQPQPQQPRYVERSESMTPLWVSGVILLPVSWVLTWTAATATEDFSGRDIDYWVFSWIPLVGPWFMLGQDNLNEAEVAGALLAGVAQATGLLLIILGVALRRTVRVATYALDESDRAPTLSFDVTGGPTSASLGLTLSHF